MEFAIDNNSTTMDTHIRYTESMNTYSRVLDSCLKRTED